MDDWRADQDDTMQCLECGAPVAIEARGFAWKTAPGRILLVKGDAPAGVAAPPAAWVRCTHGHTYAVVSGPLANDREGGEPT